MSIHYNLNALSVHENFSVYDLVKSGVVGTSTCNALYQQQPIMTNTLLRILDFADCGLEDFLYYRPDEPLAGRTVRSLDLNGMVKRGVISRTAKRYFQGSQPMNLATLILIAEDQGADLLDFFQIETETEHDSAGNLKKRRKVLYLSEW